MSNVPDLKLVTRLQRAAASVPDGVLSPAEARLIDIAARCLHPALVAESLATGQPLPGAPRTFYIRAFMRSLEFAAAADEELRKVRQGLEDLAEEEGG